MSLLILLKGGSAAQTLTPARFDNSNDFFAATVTTGAVNLSPGLYSNSNTLYGPTVTPGAVDLTPARYDNAQTFYSATVDQATYLYPARYDNAQSFYAATITTGPVTLTAARYDNSQTFYAPTVTPGTRTLTQTAFYRKNYVKNSTFTGFVAGTPGSSPNWDYFATTQHGVTRQIIGTGTENGLTYVDVRYFGTGTSNPGYFEIKELEDCSPGAKYTASMYLSLQAGTLPASKVYIQISDLGPGAYYAGSTGGALSLTATQTRYSHSRTISDIRTKLTTGGLQFSVSLNETVDFTIRIAAPQFEEGLSATAFIPTSGTAVEVGPTNTFYSSSVDVGVSFLQPPLFTNSNTFYAATITTGPVTLTAARYDNTQTFYAATIPPPIRALVQRNFNRSNRVPNSTMIGAAVGTIGSGGVIPTGWTWQAASPLNRSVVATGTLPDGNPYIDLRVWGTNNTGATQYPDLYIPSTSLVPANAGMQVSVGLYIDLIAGSRSGFFYGTGTRLSLGEFSSTGQYLADTVSNVVTYGSRATLTRTLTDARTARSVLFVSFAVPNGNTVDVTLRFAAPQVEYGPVTDYIPTFGNPVEVATVNTFYAPTVAVGAALLQPSLYTNSNTFYAATATAGPVTLQPGLYANSNTLYAPTVTPGAVALSPARYDNAQTFYAHTVSAGAVAQNLAPTRYDNSQSFYSATATASNSLSASLVTNSQTFFAATVTPGAVALAPSRADNAQVFYQPVIGIELRASRLDGAQDLYAPSVGYGLLASTLYGSQAFYAPTLTGNYPILAGRFDNANQIFVPKAFAYRLTPAAYMASATIEGNVATAPAELIASRVSAENTAATVAATDNRAVAGTV